MQRSILFSLLVIGAAIGIVAGMGSFAAFTDTSTGVTDGGISSGDIELLVDGDGISEGDETDGAGQDVGFTFTLEGCDTELLAPPAVCTRVLTVTNDGDLPFTWVAYVFSNDDGDDTGAPGVTDDTVNTCFNVAIAFPAGSAPAYSDLDEIGESNSGDVTPGAGNYPGGEDSLAPTESQTFRVSAAIADDSSCQDLDSNIVVTVVATHYIAPQP